MRNKKIKGEMEILEFVDKANKAKTTDTLFGLFKTALKPYGYDRVLFSLMTDHIALGLPAGHGVMQNYPDDWMKHYVAKGYENDDPVRCFAFAKSGPFIWDELPLFLELGQRQQDCLNGGREAGLNNGAAVSLRGPNNEISAIGAASSDDGEIAENAPFVLHMLGQHFYYAYQQIILKQKGKSDKIKITAQEREILHWLGAGKSLNDIGTIINLSEAGVKYHLAKIYTKMGTNNRHTTVVKALYNGLITL